MDPSSHPEFSEIYDQLRSIAQRKLAQLPPGQTLQATALVHEAWLKLAGSAAEFGDAEHLRAAAAQAMRWILVDVARRRGAKKRQANLVDLLDGAVAIDAADGDDGLLRLDRALTRFESVDPRRAQVVLMRFFGGLSVEDTAKSLAVSPATVKRDWQFSRAWLLRAVSEDSEES